MAFGKPMVPRHRLLAADVILSLDSDFLGEGAEQTRLSREFAGRREPSRAMSRLYAVEPAVTVTGAMADHRLRMQGSEVGAFAAALCSMLASRGLEKLAPLASLSHGERKWDMKWLVALAVTWNATAAARWSSPAAASRRRSTRWPPRSTPRSETSASPSTTARR
jgi:molybdopterin-containing oxidoreductase family iron-sulfur binding subunit